MFECGVAGEEVGPAVDPVLGPAGFLTGAVEQLAKLPSELWRVGNEGFAGIAAAMDALAVQLECARVGLVQEAEDGGWWTSRRRLRVRRG
jgi:hypothetical protein